ncbi:restriction endonuclease subunit S [Campylobacter lari]|uniref:Restriction endonuclease subunit S n=1 Tax=Campylobacter lari TaxID=201 RepID=A0A7U8APN5_CAMLA|nr:restriction endonuclease subunit S [Campylobacter lari]
MNKIEKLLKELCPNGVEFKSLGEIGFFFNGLSGKKKDDFKNGNAKYITYLNVFNNIAVDLKEVEFVQVYQNEKQNTLKRGDVLFTLSSESLEECGMSSVVVDDIPEPIYLNSFCFGFRFNDIFLLPDFSKYLFRDERVRRQIYKTANGVTRFNISKVKFEKIKIPLPPLEVQEEIVKILDTFTKLEAELEARRRQYEYYRNKLLSFEYLDKNGGGYELKMLGEVCEISTGNSNSVDEEINGIYPFYTRSQEIKRINRYEFDETAIITSGDGVGVGKVIHFMRGKYTLHQRAYRIHILQDSINPKFVYFYMKAYFYDYIMKTAVNSSVSSLRMKMLTGFQIPIPLLETQEKIVNILDKFHTLTTDLQSGIPAEIKARKKQYEYYRNQLLTFKEAI